MAKVIQFPCPACGGILQIPISGASQRGPCPQCHQPIIAPDPLRGRGACRLATQPLVEPAYVPQPAVQQPAPPPEPPAQVVYQVPQPVYVQPQPAPAQAATPVWQPPQDLPFQIPPAAPPAPAPASAPFSESPRPPLIQEPVAPPSRPSPIYPEPTPVAPPASNFKLGLATALLLGTLAAILAFAGGYQTGKGAAQASATPRVTLRKSDAPLKAEVPPQTTHALSEPKAVLEAFLSASDWKTRGVHTLFPETVLPKMEAYYAKHPDRDHATSQVKVRIENCEANEDTELMLVIFRVFTVESYEGYPVAVAETRDGWKVDWESFVEFQDRLFQKFVSDKGEETSSFHLIVLPPTPDATPGPQAPYVLSDPISGRKQQAFIGKDAELGGQIAKLLEGKRFATPVLKLSRKADAEGNPRIEIVAIDSPIWHPGVK